MAGYCENCGCPQDDDSRFCMNCGAQIEGELPAIKEKTGKGIHFIEFAVVFVLLIMVFIGFVKPGYLRRWIFGSEGKISLTPGKSYAIDDEHPVVETKDGVIVDFGTYNDLGETELKIQNKGDLKDKDEGVTRSVYSFTVDGRTEFDGMIDITLSYDEDDTIPGDEEGSVLAQYYNEELGEWELVDYTVDTQANTVTIVTDHLSDYCMVTVNQADTPLASIAQINKTAMLSNDELERVWNEYVNAGEPGENALEVGYSAVSEMFGLGDNMLTFSVLGGADGVSAFGEGMTATPVLDNVGEYTQKIGVSLAIAQLAYDLYKGDNTTTAVNAYKNTFGIGISYYGTSALKLGMVGVFAIDYALSSFTQAADQQYEDDIYRYLEYYNDTYSPRSEAEWYNRLIEIYNKYPQDPMKQKEEIDKELDSFSGRYFKLSRDERSFVIGDVGGREPYNYDYREIEPRCINRYKVKLGQKLQPVFSKMKAKIYHDIKMDYIKELNNLKRELNSQVTLAVKENVKNGEKAVYKGYQVAIVTERGSIPNENWIMELNSDGSAQMNLTLYGYIRNNCPSVLDVYKPGDKIGVDEPVTSVSFTLTSPRTEVTLGNTELTFDDIIGDWAAQITVTGADSNLMDSITSQMEQNNLDDYADMYRDQTYDMNGTDKAIMTIEKTGDNTADISLTYENAAYNIGKVFEGYWKDGVLYLSPSGNMLVNQFEMYFEKNADGLKCHATTSYSSQIISYKYEITGTK